MAIIAISGRIGSGKDLVTNMIKYIVAQYECHGQLHDPFVLNITNYQYKTLWENKKFEAKLKQMVSLLTGIPVEKLEHSEVKNSELGEEWWLWEETSSWNPFTTITAYTPNKTKPVFMHEHLVKTTVRQLLQQLGTDAVRDQVHPNAWVNALFADYKSQQIIFSGMTSYMDPPKYEYPNWIISDMRFPNEMEAVKARGGITVRIERDYALRGAESDPKKLHPSETALDNAEFDCTIYNNSDIPALLDNVKSMLLTFKLI